MLPCHLPSFEPFGKTFGNMFTLKMNYQTLAHLLIILSVYCFTSVNGLIVVDSMKMVACVNNNVCHNGMNLRIVLNASTIESSAGSGSIFGAITPGEVWTDSFGIWKLDKSLDIQMNYKNAAREYHLINGKRFPSQVEQWCSPSKCDETAGPCRNERGYGLHLVASGAAMQYTIQKVEKWEANLTIQSTHANLKWDANDIRNSIWNSDVEAYIEAVFNTDSCYQDLERAYYVVTGTDTDYYWTSKQYWQDERNNFNISASTYQNDFDCSYKWPGWHSIIPFFDDEDEYTRMAGDDGSSESLILSWASDQLYMWQQGYIDRYFYEIMADCIDLTAYPDRANPRGKQPNDNFWKVTTLQIMDHFRITIDLDYTLFVSSPTKSPTSLSPSQSPTSNPVIPTTNAPSKSPTVCMDNIWDFYEIAAKIEIQSISIIDVSIPTVSINIIESLAFGLNIGKEFIRLDFAEFNSKRRLQSNIQLQKLILGFTIFASSEDEKIMFKTKLEETSTYYLINRELNDTLSIYDIESIYIGIIMDECEAGTQLITIAGQRKCESICNVNHYYDIASNSCKEQVEFSTTIVIEKNYLLRILFFGIGIIAWIATLFLGCAVYKYCFKNKLKAEMNDKSTTKMTNKKSVETRAFDADDSDLEESEYSSYS